MVSSGLGVAVVDPFSAREYATRGVVARPFEPAIQFQVAALYPAHRSLSPLARDFITQFAAQMK
jgi:DNA-binding transcriptional LysR family regulator